jgi:regulator of protease activity HflC (stomatin/prohibitin superfamily)
MAFGIMVVKQFEKMVVLRWGQLNRISHPGLRFVVPIMEDAKKVDLRERVQRVPTQKYITSDNVVVDMDFVIYYRVVEDIAERSVLNVRNFESAVVNMAVATLRTVIGATTLASALADRERMRETLQVSLDEVTDRWAVKVTQVAINEIDPPPNVKSAMEREKSAEAIKTAEITESEGQRQAAINRAEGEKQSAILTAEGRRQSEILTAEGDQAAEILRAEGFSKALDRIYQVANNIDEKTLSLQYFETLKAMGSSPSTKFIFPMEFTSMLKPFLNLVKSKDETRG